MNNNEIMDWANSLMDSSVTPFTEGFGPLPAFRVYAARGKSASSARVLRRYTDGRMLILRDYEMVGIVSGCGSENRVLDALHRRLDLIFDALPARVGGQLIRFAKLCSRPCISVRKGHAAVARAGFSLAEECEGEPFGVIPFFPNEGKGWSMGRGLYDMKLSCTHTDGQEQTLCDRYRTAVEAGLAWQVEWRMARDLDDAAQNRLLKAANAPEGGKFPLVLSFGEGEGGELEGKHAVEGEGSAISCEMAVDVHSLQLDEHDVVLHCRLTPKGMAKCGVLGRNENGEWRFTEQTSLDAVKRKEGIA